MHKESQLCLLTLKVPTRRPQSPPSNRNAILRASIQGGCHKACPTKLGKQPRSTQRHLNRLHQLLIKLAAQNSVTSRLCLASQSANGNGCAKRYQSQEAMELSWLETAEAEELLWGILIRGMGIVYLIVAWGLYNQVWESDSAWVACRKVFDRFTDCTTCWRNRHYAH